MHFLDLHIHGFGKFHDTSLNFQDGLNVIYGKNEAGKSTIHSFIRGMLFGMERQRGRAARTDLYSKYEPWENSGTYEGKLRLEKNGTIYRIERSFGKNKKELTIIDESAGREITPAKPFLDELLGGLSETTYNNTISIGQLKSATDSGMISELKNFIANMNSSGNMSLNITKATSYLKNQKKHWESQLTKEVSKTYHALLEEIRTLEQEISSPRYKNQLAEYQNEKQEIEQEIEFLLKHQASLKEKIEHGNETLKSFHLSDEDSVSACLNSAEALYADYYRASFISGHKNGSMIAFCCFLTAFFSAGVGAFLVFNSVLDKNSSMLQIFSLPQLTLALSAICFTSLGIGIFINVIKSKRQKEAVQHSEALSDLLEKFLKKREISDRSMEELRSRLEELSILCKAVESSKAALSEEVGKISDLRSKLNLLSKQIEQQQYIQWELEKKLEHLSDCKDRITILKYDLLKNERIQQEISALDLAQQTMKDLSLSIRDSFGLYLNQAASELISGITGGIYRSISIDENLNAFLNTEKKLIPIEQVSGGTADQIYLALRLAAAKFMQGGKTNLPLIFDDTFVLYDEERLSAALRWLSSSNFGQILLFSCHEREKQILKEQQIPFHEIKL